MNVRWYAKCRALLLIGASAHYVLPTLDDLLYFKLMETLLRLSHILLSYIEHSYIFIASSLEQLEQSQQHEPTTLQLVSGGGYSLRLLTLKLKFISIYKI